MNPYLAAPLIELASREPRANSTPPRRRGRGQPRDWRHHASEPAGGSRGAGEESLVRVMGELERRRQHDYQDVRWVSPGSSRCSWLRKGWTSRSPSCASKLTKS